MPSHLVQPDRTSRIAEQVRGDMAIPNAAHLLRHLGLLALHIGGTPFIGNEMKGAPLADQVVLLRLVAAHEAFVGRTMRKEYDVPGLRGRCNLAGSGGFCLAPREEAI
jgi:hypothetical protein